MKFSGVDCTHSHPKWTRTATCTLRITQPVHRISPKVEIKVASGHMLNRKWFSCWNRWNDALGYNMDGTWSDHAKWSKGPLGSERQLPRSFTPKIWKRNNQRKWTSETQSWVFIFSVKIRWLLERKGEGVGKKEQQSHSGSEKTLERPWCVLRCRT